jgi:hypothetical protein
MTIIPAIKCYFRCENKTSCLNNVTSIDDAKNNRCDTLKKSDMVDGTVCRYCCESDNDVSSIACLKNLETIINHTYSQNAGKALNNTGIVFI